MLKRINKEIKDLTIHYDGVYSFAFNEELLHLYVMNKDQEKLRIAFPKQYPFNSPSILTKYFYHNYMINYNKFCVNLSSNFEVNKNYMIYFFITVRDKKYPKIFSSHFNRKDCLCCKSLTCGNNWVPSKTVKMVIEESNEIVLLSKLFKILNLRELKRIFDYFDEKKLNNDILDNIIKYCIS